MPELFLQLPQRLELLALPHARLAEGQLQQNLGTRQNIVNSPLILR
jgi:hypothetical protein